MNLFKKILWFNLSFLLTMIFCELFIKYSFLSTYGMTQFEEEVGRIRNKNNRFVHFNEGFGIFDVNQYGYLETKSTEKFISKGIDIAFLGDSYVESFQVFTRHHFLSHLENNLQHLKVNTMNFGRSGFDFADMYGYKREFVDSFNPDLSVYMINNNDLHLDGSNDPLIPRARLVESQLRTKPLFNIDKVNNFIFFQTFLNNSVVINLINKCRKKINSSSLYSIIFAKPNLPISKFHKNIDYEDSILAPIIYKILDTISPKKTIIINIGKKPLPQTFLSKCNENGIQCFDFKPIFKSMEDSNYNPYYWDVTNKYGHWNHYTHKLIGKYCTKIIQEFIDNNFETNISE
mgnify:CR=1 FL=1